MSVCFRHFISKVSVIFFNWSVLIVCASGARKQKSGGEEGSSKEKPDNFVWTDDGSSCFWKWQESTKPIREQSLSIGERRVKGKWKFVRKISPPSEKCGYNLKPQQNIQKYFHAPVKKNNTSQNWNWIKCKARPLIWDSHEATFSWKCERIKHNTELRLASSLIEKRKRLWKADIDDNREKKHE